MQIVKIGDFLKESREEGSRGDLARKITVKLYGKGVYAKHENRPGSINTQYFRRRKGQFIYSKLDFLNGAFGLIPNELDGYETTIDLPCFDFYGQLISPDWFLYYVSRKEFYDTQAYLANGGRKARRISPKDFFSLKIEIPPLPEQKQIAVILTSVDEVIEKTEAQIEKLQDLKTAMMNELLTKGIGHTEYKDSELGRIPKDWEVQPLERICDLQVGYAFKSAWFTEAGIKLLRGENVGYGEAKWDASRYLDYHKANEFSPYLLSEGDVVIGMDRTFTKSGSKITRISSNDLPCLLVQRVGRFRSENLDSDFLWQLLRSESYLNQLAANEKGMDIPHLSKQEILEPIVPLIPKKEQIKISSILKSIDEQSKLLRIRRTHTQSLKKSLMQDLLTGKVRVLSQKTL